MPSSIMEKKGLALLLLILVLMCPPLSGRIDHVRLQSRGSSSSGEGSKSPLRSHDKGKAPAHGGPSVRLFGVNVTPGHKSVPQSQSRQSGRSHSTDPTKAGASHSTHLELIASSHQQSGSQHSGLPSHLAESVQPIHAHKGPPVGVNVSRKPKGRPLGSKNKSKSVAPAVKLARGEKWWKVAGGRPKAPAAAFGYGRRYESQKKWAERKKLKQAGKIPDDHPAKHPPPPPGGPGSPGASSHAVSKRNQKRSAWIGS